MTPSTKSFRQLFVISFLIITFTTTAMHNQLQLQDPTKQNNIPTFNDYSLMLSERQPSLMYVSQSVHTDIFTESNLQSTIKNPVVLIKIIDNARPKKIKTLPLPVKQLLSCDTKSMVQLCSALYVTGEPVVINACCVANPKLYNKIDNKITNNTFAQQLNTYANEFYEYPAICTAEKDAEDTIQTLENTEIITITKTYTPLLADFSFFEEQKIFSHNPKNGCPNKKALIKQIIAEEIPHNQNWVTYLKKREYGNTLGKQQ
jgi:hypothetical protein